MALEKARITPDGEDAILILFNPNQYSLDKNNQYAELGIPGLSAPILQYVRGGTRTLSMELFFDTYEQQTDVREHTNQIYGLLGINRETHVPPICTFEWGDFDFRGVLERVSGRYTLFLSDGTPVRATLNVTLKEYVEIEVEVRRTPTESVDHFKTRVVQAGDTVSSIAAKEYKDPRQWRPIARANQIANPRVLQPGRSLVLPPLKK
ncbi:MAG: LysM peptidoglycan-binding domain-containing protein [Anaerolineae bacterium]|nr:LysM peptidoglycan-binding domain-containing protein [Anaerolineae bacterium]